MSGFAAVAVSSLVSSGVQSLGGVGKQFSDTGELLSTFGSRNKDLLNAITIASGGLSGGISSTIAGGNFWAGARQGLIVSGLNHTLHKMTGPTPKKLTAAKALQKYRSGTGGIVDVDLSSIDFSNADLSTPVYDKNGNIIAYRINLDGSAFANSDDAIVHGTITVERVNGNTFRVAQDPDLGCRCGDYDFDQHDWEPWYSTRNLVTRYAEFVHKFDSYNIKWYSDAKPFIIRYNGTVKIGK